MPELVYSIQEPIAETESQQGVHEPKSGRLHEGRPRAVNPQFRARQPARIGPRAEVLLSSIRLAAQPARCHGMAIAPRFIVFVPCWGNCLVKEELRFDPP